MNNLKLLLEKPIAHRGLHNEYFPENSIGAIKNAFINDYSCEIDVQLTKDNKVIVFHDRSLLRMTGVDKFISETNYSELKTIYLNKTNETIPLLYDVIEFIKEDCILLIEIKNVGLSRKLENCVINLLDQKMNNIFIQSFNPFTVFWIKRRHKEIPVGFITSDFKDERINPITKYFLTRSKIINLLDPDFISLDVSMNGKNKVLQHKQNNKAILCWTIDSIEKLNYARSFSDNIIFEKIIP